MKVFGSVLLVVLKLQHLLALHSTHDDRSVSKWNAIRGTNYHPLATDYILRAIEYLTSVHGGVFRCVFYDIAPQQVMFDNILGDVLRSPRLDRDVVKYVVNGSYRQELEKLPRSPEMLLIDPGSDFDRLNSKGVFWNVFSTLCLFNPTTKVLVFVDNANEKVTAWIEEAVEKIQFSYFVFFDGRTLRSRQCNGIGCWILPRMKYPMYLFTYGHRFMRGWKVPYIVNFDISSAYNELWMKETVSYLQAEAVRVQHDCKGTGHLLLRCLKKYEKKYGKVAIIFSPVWILPDIPRDFRHLFTSIPIFLKIAVPRDRPLNAAELFVLPFHWEVWLLLLLALAMAESLKYFFPNHFVNDPILLVVCGFERHNLHETGRWEKMILHSLIILMFFASNAFETRIISLMISKPSIQRVKTLQDLETYGIKFYADLDRYPKLVNHPTIGKYIINGRHNLWDTLPGIGIYANEQTASLAPEIAFDHKRNLPWYVALDYRSLDGFQLFQTSFRNSLLPEFELIRLLLTEAGIYALWEQRNIRTIVGMLVGRRLREKMDDKIYLNMDDIVPAWMILGIGCGIAVVVFLGELVRERVNVRGWVVLLGKWIGIMWMRCRSWKVKYSFSKKLKIRMTKVVTKTQKKSK